MYDKTLTKVYKDREYISTTMVRHNGTVVGFALGADRRVYYSVLSLDQADRARGALDAAYWNADPAVLVFPAEIVDVGAESPQVAVMPVVKKLGSAEVPPSEKLLPGEEDPFLSTTARLTSEFPIQVVSDGRYLLVFRQSVAAGATGSVYETTAGRLTGDATGGKPAKADAALLCDRFVLVGAELKPVVDVRYQRSRSRILPASGGDTLGTRDMEGKPFFEPTMKLSFAGRLTGGLFTALTLPTAVTGHTRWQIFTADTSGTVHGHNLEQTPEGLFNPAGTELWTSPDPKYAASVLERSPGIDSHTRKLLVPVKPPQDRAGTALRFDGTGTPLIAGLDVTAAPAGPYTLEAWIKPAAATGTGLIIGRTRRTGMDSPVHVSLQADGRLRFGHGTQTLTSTTAAPTGVWAHVAAVFDGAALRLYLNGAAAGTLTTSETVDVSARIVVGGRGPGQTPADGFAGLIDEVRIWTIARTDFATRGRRLSGGETGLYAYFPLDEGAGVDVRDRAPNRFSGRFDPGPVWTDSDAPVYDGPGITRQSFTVTGRKAVAGLTATLYYQQQSSVTGYGQAPVPERRQARVLLAFATSGPPPQGEPADRSYVATLDFAVSKDGRLARVPGVVDLAWIGTPDPTKDAERVRQSEDAVTAARAKLYTDQQLTDWMPATQARLNQLGEELHNGGIFSMYTLNRTIVGPARNSGRQREAEIMAEVMPLVQRLIQQQEASRRLGADKAALDAALNTLATLTGAQAGAAEAVLPMPTLHTDRSGLTTLGALLSFAWTANAPALLDSSTGEVALYFRGGAGQYFAAYYAATIAPAVKQFTVADGTLRLSARDMAVKSADFAVKVTAAGAGLCTVEVSRGTTRETFPSVPDQADRLASVLNGTARGTELGTVLSVQDTVVTLIEPLATALTAGTAVTVGGDARTAEAAPAGSTQITLTGGGLTAGTGAKVRTPAYDYTKATCSAPGVSVASGSLIVSANAQSATGPVPAGTAADVSQPLGPRWHGDAPGRAFSFDRDAKNRLHLANTANIAALAASGDLTLEAWIRPTVVNNGDLILATDTGPTRYALSLEQLMKGDGSFAYRIAATVNEQSVQSADLFPPGEWAHLAVAFTQDWAMRMDGGGYLDAGGPGGLDIVENLTIEAFVQIESGGRHGLVGKGVLGDGGQTAVPYCLYVDHDNRLAFAFEAGSGTTAPVVHKSTTALTTGRFHKVAVVRRNPTGIETGVEIRFYVDGADAGSHRYKGAKPVGNDAPAELGRMVEGKTVSGLKGVLSEVRIWNVARDADQIGVPISPKAQGLVAWWRFPESKGSTTQDMCGSYPATLRAVTRVRTPDPAGNRFTLYRNGSPVATEPMTRPAVARSAAPRSVVGEGFTGDLDEIRVWRTIRTQEQVLDNMFGRVKGDRQHLLAYYPFEADDTTAGALVKDAGLSGQHLTQSAPGPKIVLSTAPISTDAARIRSALTGVKTPFHGTIAATPAATEYGDVQRLPDDSIIGVLKRAYGYLQDDKSWALSTGFKVGELATTWVGQVQFDPQLIGYIEGAPPVPSENMTDEKKDYAGASSVSFVQADNVVNTMSSQRDVSVDTAMKIALDQSFGDEVWAVAAPLGAGTAKPISAVKQEWGFYLSLDFSNSWSDTTEVSQGANTTRASKVTLAGGWEDADGAKHVNPSVGRRWVPANTGFAVVQSETADMYALRLTHSGAVVAYRMLPSPDIPRDWNLIPFPINPRYTKQGTLDGIVGYHEYGQVPGLRPFPDPHFPNAADGVSGEYSYYRPAEAYRIKKRIQREQQQLQGFYDSVSVQTHTWDPTHGQAAKVLNGMTGTTGATTEAGSGGDPEAKRAATRSASRRNIVNTYVWTAAGGFFAETTATTDQVTETTSGAFSFKSTFGGNYAVSFDVMNYGNKFGVEASVGAGYSVTRKKSKQATRTFSLDVSCGPGAELQKFVGDKPQFDAEGKPILVPGRVDAYRFMTLYLDTTTDNFEDFYGKVIDPEWLDRGTDPNALALKRARQTETKPPCWRIMHRVTFVSRVLDTGVSTPSLAQAMGSLGIASDYALITRLQPHLTGATKDFAALNKAARAALAGNFARLAPYADTIVGRLAAYYNLQPDDAPLTPALPAAAAAPDAKLTLGATSVPRGTSLTFAYSTLPATVSAKNWIGLYPVTQAPKDGPSIDWRYTPGADGTLVMPTDRLPGAGAYAAYYLHNDGYTVLAGPIRFTVT